MEAAIARWLAAGNFDLLVCAAVYYLPGNDCFAAEKQYCGCCSGRVIICGFIYYVQCAILFRSCLKHTAAYCCQHLPLGSTRKHGRPAGSCQLHRPLFRYKPSRPACTLLPASALALLRKEIVKLFYCVFSPGSLATHRFFNVLPTIFPICVTTIPLKQLINLLSL
jgi:hypothetical protein